MTDLEFCYENTIRLLRKALEKSYFLFAEAVKNQGEKKIQQIFFFFTENAGSQCPLNNINYMKQNMFH